MATQSGSIDGISYASSKPVYDTQGDGIVTDILYYDQAGHQVADQTVFPWPPFPTGPKTVNADGSFSITVTPPPGDGGVSNGYLLEAFSNQGIWQREDVYSPIFNSTGGVSGYKEVSYGVVNFTTGSINGAYYDSVLTNYLAGGRPTETDYRYDLNGDFKIVATQWYPNPVLNVPPTETMTTGTTHSFVGVYMSDPWAANHPGTLALTISTDAGAISGTDAAGHAFSATPGSAARLTGTLAQINSDLASLKFSDLSPGTAHVNFLVYDQAGLSDSKRDTITVSGSSPPPPTGLSGPSALTIPADTLLHGLNVSYYDPWAANHAGLLALNATTTLGALTDVVAGHSTTGTSLHLTGSYAQIEADLSGLALTSSQAGTGSVRIEVYNQAGVESVHLIGVTAQASA